ncbi:MAG TPA: hypothetical protein VF775_01680 [Geobacteraceae bacterium]
MQITSLCKSISSSLSHNLRLAKSDDERNVFAAEALDHAGKAVLPELDRLRAERGERSAEYLRAQEAVAEGLLGMNSLKEFRYHVDFKRGVIEWGG